MPQNTNQTALPWRFPRFRVLALLAAAGCSYLTEELWYRSSNPVQQFYLPRYARLSFVPSLKGIHYSINRGFDEGTTEFDVLTRGEAVATTANVATLSGALAIRKARMDPAAFRDWLQERGFNHRTFLQFIHFPLYMAITWAVSLFFAGSCFDRRRMRKARHGLTLRGPGLVSRWRFNRKTKGDGLRFRVINPRNLFELTMPGKSGQDIVIPKNREAHHVQISGAIGAGKTIIVRQIIEQIQERGEVAIINDPKREYIQEYFCEERGDWVLNPLDERCPYWELESEALTEAEATSIALSAWPDEPNQQPFFKKHPRAIFAYLISRYNRFNCPEDPATCESLARWLANPRGEITPRLEGTRHAVSTDANAKDQSQGLWATLGEVATPLGMMPPFDERRREWTVREWADKRKGWIFITSTPDTITALRPLQSLWLDMLLLKLQADVPEPGKPRVWTIMDELASLNTLPQLENAMTLNRASDNPIVLGFQAMEQIEARYGDKTARVILSQAFTNIILRIKGSGAQHQSDLIGKAQLERLRETQPSRLFEARQGSYNTERVVDPVVMDSQIQMLEDLSGYFVQKASIIPIRFKPTPKRIVAPALIPRAIAPARPHPPQPPTAGETQAVVPVANKTAKDLVFEEIKSRKPC